MGTQPEQEGVSYDYGDLEGDVNKIVQYIERNEFHGIFPVNNGGHVLAAHLSNRTEMPIDTCSCNLRTDDIYVLDNVSSSEELEKIVKRFSLRPEQRDISSERVDVGMFAVMDTFFFPIMTPIYAVVSLVQKAMGNKACNIFYPVTRKVLKRMKEKRTEEAPYQFVMLHKTNGLELPTEKVWYVNEKGIEPGYITYPWNK